MSSSVFATLPHPLVVDFSAWRKEDGLGWLYRDSVTIESRLDSDQFTFKPVTPKQRWVCLG